MADRTKVKAVDQEHKTVKQNLNYCQVPGVCRADFVKDLLEVRWNTMKIDVIEGNFEIKKIFEIEDK